MGTLPAWQTNFKVYVNLFHSWVSVENNGRKCFSKMRVGLGLVLGISVMVRVRFRVG